MSYEDSFIPISQNTSSSGYENGFVPVPQYQAQPFGEIGPAPSSTEKALTLMNAPFAGLTNAATDMGLGATQFLSGLTGDDKSDVYQGINDLKNIKDQQTQDSMTSNPSAQLAYGAGNIAGDVGLYSMMPGGLNAKEMEMANQLPTVSKYISSVLPSAAKGYGFNQLQPAQNEQDRENNSEWGAAGSALGQTGGNLLSTQVSDPNLQKIMQTAEENNIPIYRNQISPSRAVGIASALNRNVPMSGAEGAKEAQQQAFGRVLNQSVGQEGDVMNAFKLGDAVDDVGDTYNQVQKNPFVASNAFNQKIQDLEANANTNLVGDQAQAFKQQVDNLRNKITNTSTGQQSSGTGQTSGELIKNLLSDMKSVNRGANGSPQLRELQNTITNQWSSTMPTEDAEALSTANQRYRNILALDSAVGRNPNGPLDPAALQGSVKQVFGDYSRGSDSLLPRLAYAGQLTKSSFPDTGTAANEKAQEYLKLLGGSLLVGGAGAGEGYHEGGEEGILPGLAGAWGLSRFGLSPYLYSKMQLGPSAMQAMGPALGNAITNYKSQQGSQ